MCKIGKFFLKLLGIFVLLNGLLFVVFFFDLVGWISLQEMLAGLL